MGQHHSSFLLSPHHPSASLWGSDVCRRACFWSEWLQSGTCSVLERIVSLIGETSKWRIKRPKKCASVVRKGHGSIAKTCPNHLPKSDRAITDEPYNYSVKHILVCFKYFAPFTKFFLAPHFQLSLWAFENVNCAVCPNAMLHQSADSCFCWNWPLRWHS